jgi:hypothetical protein
MNLTISASVNGDPNNIQVQTPSTPSDWLSAAVPNGGFIMKGNDENAPGPIGTWAIGDGKNDKTVWTFDFSADPNFGSFLASQPITSALLTLTLIAEDSPYVTDTVNIDTLEKLGDGQPAAFQTTAFKNNLVVGNPVTVQLDLSTFYTSSRIFTVFMGGGGVPMGRIPMVYRSNAIAVSAKLELTQPMPDPPGPFRIPRDWYAYDMWWKIKTHGGLLPPSPWPDPIGPWFAQFAAALSLADAARSVSPRLRASVLQLALQQISIASAALKKEIKGVKSK